MFPIDKDQSESYYHIILFSKAIYYNFQNYL